MAQFSLEETYTKVTSIIAEKLNIDVKTIKPQATVQELGADSLDLVEIILKLEESFNIEIADEDLAHLNTVQDFVDYIHRKRIK